MTFTRLANIYAITDAVDIVPHVEDFVNTEMLVWGNEEK